MNSYKKYLGIIILIIFSFYYADKISHLIIYQSNLMKQITQNKNNYELMSENAQIVDDQIIPGINGIEVDEVNSYYQMKPLNMFSTEKYVFIEVKPQISVDNNRNYIIKRGNIKKEAISIILYNNDKIIKYAKENNLLVDELINEVQIDDFNKIEQLNYSSNYKQTMNMLNKYNINTNICVINNNKQECKNYQQYLVEPTYLINNYTILNNSIESGDIILIDQNLSLENFKFLLKKIEFSGLRITYLSNLISEKRNS